MTCEQALALARHSLMDDMQANADWLPLSPGDQRRLARFVERVLGAPEKGALVDDDMRAEYQPERPRCVTMGPRIMLPATARAIAAALLRAADEAEAEAMTTPTRIADDQPAPSRVTAEERG